MLILGISAFYHDAAAAIICDGVIVAAAQEERFTRKKHDPSFPVNAIRYCLQAAGCSIDELEAVAFYDKPLLKFERLLDTYYAFAPKGVRSFIQAMPVWIREKLFLKKLIRDGLKEVELFDKKKLKLLFPEHHLSHAASAFYPSGYTHAAILTIDGVGEWATASICEGSGSNITIHKELSFPHSLGLLYSAFTYYLGFRVNSGEYKLMGLAPYANPQSAEVQQYLAIIYDKLAHLKADGSLWLNQSYFSYTTGSRMARDRKWEKLFGFPRRQADVEEINRRHCSLAMAVQLFTEEAVIRMAREAKRITGADQLCMAGGVALNCVANGRLEREGIFSRIFIQPAAGDAGGAPGAALAAYHIYCGGERERKSDQDTPDGMKGSYLGPAVLISEIEALKTKYKAVCQVYDDFNGLCNQVAAYLSEGAAIGWVQGRMEFGPRALGNRSIIGDARNEEMQKRLNLKVKYRESFRPFAPAVLAEDAAEYFDIRSSSPYMLVTYPVKKSLRLPLPAGYHAMDIKDKLYVKRSQLPAVTHVDFSARVQTVHRDTNPEFHALISEFKQRTGYSVIVNTSFNVRGEPIVCTAEDAYRCFMRTGLDYLVINNCLFIKAEQPEWLYKSEWREEFTLD